MTREELCVVRYVANTQRRLAATYGCQYHTLTILHTGNVEYVLQEALVPPALGSPVSTNSGLISRNVVTPARYDELLRLVGFSKTKDSTGNCYGNAERMTDATFVGAPY